MDETGVPFSYVVILYEDFLEGSSDATTVQHYIDQNNLGLLPVFADPQRDILANTPYNGPSDDMPGKCLVDKRMQLIDCYTGPSVDTVQMNWIREQEGLR